MPSDKERENRFKKQQGIVDGKLVCDKKNQIGKNEDPHFQTEKSRYPLSPTTLTMHIM